MSLVCWHLGEVYWLVSQLILAITYPGIHICLGRAEDVGSMLMTHYLHMDGPWTISGLSEGCLCFLWINHGLLMDMQCQLAPREQSTNNHQMGSRQST